MRVLEYEGLDTSRVASAYARVKTQLERGDTRSADLKKLSGSGFYRAKLDHANRLLIQLVRYRDERIAVVLEVIAQHAYDRSRFLGGAMVDDSKVEEAVQETSLLPELVYVHPKSSRIHLLDKVLSFDDVQASIYQLAPPLILIGSAGSGKTALTLEKMKQAKGEVLYVTRSAYLASHARNLYFSNGYRAEEQTLSFLSLAELVATLGIPAGREGRFTDFRQWFDRHRRASRHVNDAHALFEEFRGVITGTSLDAPWLSRSEYLSLGVRRSIFLDEAREEVYGLFEKYLEWMKEAGLHDANIVAQERLSRAQPVFDFVVADEVQDLTPVELMLILRLLRKSGQFILCGDSNQIVHPNFFSWSSIKSLFFADDSLASGRAIAVLQTNYRNAVEVTAIANRLLRLKTARFGSVDRESQYEVIAQPSTHGEIELLRDAGNVVADVDGRTRRSRHYAVIVLRDEDKAEAARRFHTPLLFSVHEAKGLEYQNVILFDVVSGNRARFDQIAEGVTTGALDRQQTYSRGSDKRDKSLELLKFYINSLYVSLTRAVKRVIWIESDVSRPLFGLLGLDVRRQGVDLRTEVSNLEEWQQEARKLELQGKQEQADAIRKEILASVPVPWQTIDRTSLRELAAKALDPKSVSSRQRKDLLEYSMFYDEPDIVDRLVRLRLVSEASYWQQHPGIVKKYLAPYAEKKPQQVIGWVQRHGVEYRNPHNLTPLMLAALAGNSGLVETLIERGADPAAVDNVGRTAFHLALRKAGVDERYARGSFPTLWRQLAPAAVFLSVDDRLVQLDASQIEYLLFNVVFMRLREQMCPPFGTHRRPGLSAQQILDCMNNIPAHLFGESRRKRSYLSGVLARNEVARDYAYNRLLFLRVQHGLYALNPRLRVRMGETWMPVYDLMDVSDEGFPGFEQRAFAGSLVDAAGRYLDDLTATTRAASEERDAAPSSC